MLGPSAVAVYRGTIFHKMLPCAQFVLAMLARTGLTPPEVRTERSVDGVGLNHIEEARVSRAELLMDLHGGVFITTHL